MKQDTILDLNLNSSSSSLMASPSTAPSFDASAFSLKVKAFCSKISLPVQPPIVLTPIDVLKTLLNPPSLYLQSTFSQEKVQELTEIHQGFVVLDSSFLIEH